MQNSIFQFLTFGSFEIMFVYSLFLQKTCYINFEISHQFLIRKESNMFMNMEIKCHPMLTWHNFPDYNKISFLIIKIMIVVKHIEWIEDPRESKEVLSKIDRTMSTKTFLRLFELALQRHLKFKKYWKKTLSI